jgi:hypothetical protein
VKPQPWICPLNSWGAWPDPFHGILIDYKWIIVSKFRYFPKGQVKKIGDKYMEPEIWAGGLKYSHPRQGEIVYQTIQVRGRPNGPKEAGDRN